MDVEAIRQQIPITKNSIYMNTGWSGPLPTPVVRAAAEAMNEEMELGPATLDAIQRSRAIAARAKEAVANLLHASQDEVLLTHNTTEGLNISVNAIRWRAGDVAVTCSLEHTAVTSAIQNTRLRHRIRVVEVQIAPDDSWETILAKFDQAITPGVKLVFLSHIEYSCGLQLPAKELVDLAHQRGALILFDGAQTGGHLNLDLPSLGADMYSIAGQKWLLGPDGTGALFIRRELIPELQPVIPRSLEGESEFGPRNNAMTKFLRGSPSGALQAAQAAAATFVASAGPQEVEERSRTLGRRLREGLSAVPGVTITSPWEEPLTCGLVSFALRDWEPIAVVEEFWRSHGIAGRRVANPAGVRLCTAFFNTEQEIDRVVEAVTGLASRP